MFIAEEFYMGKKITGDKLNAQQFENSRMQEQNSHSMKYYEGIQKNIRAIRINSEEFPRESTE